MRMVTLHYNCLLSDLPKNSAGRKKLFFESIFDFEEIFVYLFIYS